MADELSIVCRHCGRHVLMHNMTKDKTGINMICLDCAKKEKSTMEPEKTTSIITAMKKHVENSSFSTSRAKTKETTEKSEKMIKYLCPNCKYKFSRKASQEVEKCPYCGKHTVVVDNALGADKLLNDSMDKRFEGW